jgi:hypothetical protein
MKRFAPLLLVFAGWILAQFAGTPQQVYAQARTSLSSLQTAIDNIINGNTTVGHATNADQAANASTLGGYRPGDFASQADLSAGLASIDADVIALDNAVAEIEATAAFHGQQIQVGYTGWVGNPGMIRYHPGAGRLQVYNGYQWLSLRFE